VHAEDYPWPKRVSELPEKQTVLIRRI